MSIRRAFTSIELLVVLSVVSVLTAVAVPGVMASLRRNAMASAVNTVVGLTEEARGLAVAMSPPIASDPRWSDDDRFGVVIRPHGDGRYVVAITRGPDATTAATWSDARRGETREVVLPAGVMVYVGGTLADEPGILDRSIGWTLAYRTGTTVVGGVERVAVGAPGSPVAERLLLRSRDGTLEADLSVFPVGLAYGGEVREP